MAKIALTQTGVQTSTSVWVKGTVKRYASAKSDAQRKGVIDNLKERAKAFADDVPVPIVNFSDKHVIAKPGSGNTPFCVPKGGYVVVVKPSDGVVSDGQVYKCGSLNAIIIEEDGDVTCIPTGAKKVDSLDDVDNDQAWQWYLDMADWQDAGGAIGGGGGSPAGPPPPVPSGNSGGRSKGKSSDDGNATVPSGDGDGTSHPEVIFEGDIVIDPDIAYV